MRPSPDKDAFIRLALDLGKYCVYPTGEICSRIRGRERFLKQSLMDDGYCRVGLSIDGKVHYVKAHRVVAIALIPNPHNKPLVNHDDGVKHHNHPDNLEWMTEAENAAHAVATGLTVALIGEDCPSSKLTAVQVAEIRHLRATTKLSQREIGERYGVKQNTVSSIELRTNWA